MLAVHDTVEIEVGDTFHYAKTQREGLKELEDAAAERIFGLLPPAQSQFYLTLWREFEARETAEAKFAAAVDRFLPFIMNDNNEGGTWRTHQIPAERIFRKA